MPENPVDNLKGKRIGLLGGSFNPAHEGHMAISQAALKTLDLDCIWWIVSPHNPLKFSHDLLDYSKRIKFAQDVASNANIKVVDIEKSKGIKYTIDTLEYLTTLYPDTDFVWIMGVDCLKKFHKWKSWKKIISLVPFAVFARPGYSIKDLKEELAIMLNNCRLSEQETKKLATTTPPAWVFIKGPLIDISASKLRQ